MKAPATSHVTAGQNLADRMVEIYTEGCHASYMGDSRYTNPYPTGTAEHHCWAHGWLDHDADVQQAIDYLIESDGVAGIICDGSGRVLAESWPVEGGAA